VADSEPIPTLTFDTLHEGAPVSIDGVRYEIRPLYALSLGGIKQIQRRATRITELMRLDPLPEAEEQELTRLLVETCAVILDAPAEVQAKLTDGQRVRICDAFIKLPA